MVPKRFPEAKFRFGHERFKAGVNGHKLNIKPKGFLEKKPHLMLFSIMVSVPNNYKINEK